MNITEIILGVTTAGSGFGWFLSHMRGKRAQELTNDQLAIESMEKIIKAQNEYIDTLNNRISSIELHFEKKCQAMQHELEVLKKKLNDVKNT